MESPWKERAIRLGSLDVDGAEDDKLCRDLALGPPEEAQEPGGGNLRYYCD